MPFKSSVQLWIYLLQLPPKVSRRMRYLFHVSFCQRKPMQRKPKLTLHACVFPNHLRYFGFISVIKANSKIFCQFTLIPKVISLWLELYLEKYLKKKCRSVPSEQLSLKYFVNLPLFPKLFHNYSIVVLFNYSYD